MTRRAQDKDAEDTVELIERRRSADAAEDELLAMIHDLRDETGSLAAQVE